MPDFSRKTTRHAIVQSDTTVIRPPLRALEIYAAGTLVVREAGSGTQFTLVYPTAANGGFYPCILEMNIDQVQDTNTTIADSNMLGIKQ